MLPHWNLDTVNFWSQIAFAFTGLELVSAMSGEIRDSAKDISARDSWLGRDDRRDLHYWHDRRADYGTCGERGSEERCVSGHCARIDSAAICRSWSARSGARYLGNAGGVGSTVAGVARVPFMVGIDRYLPAAFGKIHPRWKTPYISILVQAIISAIVLAVDSGERVREQRISDSGGCGDHSLFYSVRLHVRVRDQTGLPRGPHRKYFGRY